MILRRHTSEEHFALKFLQSELHGTISAQGMEVLAASPGPEEVAALLRAKPQRDSGVVVGLERPEDLEKFAAQGRWVFLPRPPLTRTIEQIHQWAGAARKVTFPGIF